MIVRKVLAAALAVVLVLGLFGGTAATEESPPETPPPTTGAPPDEEPGDTDDGTDVPWATILLVIILAIVVFGLVRIISRSAADRRRVNSAFRQRLSGANSTARWVHDSLAFELSNPALDDNPEMLRTAWSTGQPRLSGLTAELHGLAGAAPGQREQRAVLDLVSAVEGLAGALATDVSMRSSGSPADPTEQAMRAESARTVAVRRSELATAIGEADRVAH
ncbi:MAG: hypothetical protein AAGA99_09160 [Actinomycetota bacterium]